MTKGIITGKTARKAGRKLAILLVFFFALSMSVPGMTGIAAGAVQNDQAGSESQNVLLKSTGKKCSDGNVLVVFDKTVSDKAIRRIIERNDGEAEDITKTGERKIVLASATEEQKETEKEEANQEKANQEEAEQTDHSAQGKLMDDLEDEKKVVAVQPNYVYKTNETDPYTEKSSARYQYFHDMIHAKEAWDKLYALKKQNHGIQRTKVAVLDTGADKNHEDLKNVITAVKSTVDGKVVDMTEDANGHGTHVSGIIGAEYGNGKGGTGVASGYSNDLIRLMVYGISQENGYFYSYDIICGIGEAVKDGAKVINMSFSGYERDRILESVIKRAHYDNDVTFVCASGNDATDEYVHPADMKEVISVSSCDRSGYKNSSTNYGFAKDVTAPGTSITSTIPGDLYAKYSGTSMAAPVVSGICALVLDAAPSLKASQVRSIICSTAASQPKGAAKDYYINNELGYGRVDADAAVSAALQPASNRVDSISIKTSRTDPVIRIYTEDLDESIYGQNDKKYKAAGLGLEALLSPANSTAKITWSSDDPSIASVDEQGYVSGLKAAESTVIRARAGGKEASVKVQVLQGTEPKSVFFDLRDDEKKMYAGETTTRFFDALSIEPKSVTNSEFYWFSSDSSIASVNDYGEVTAISPGKAVISVRTYNGKKASFEVTVKQPPSHLEITSSNDWLTVGQKYRYSASVKDSAGKMIDGEKTEWSSGNEELAAVSEDGTVTAKKDGVIYLYAKVSWEAEIDGQLSVYKKITITKKNYKGKDYKLKKKKAGKRYAVLKWKKIPKVTGYELARSDKKKGKYKTIRKLAPAKTQYKDRKLKKGKTYYYKVRAIYVKDGKKGKYSFSNTVKVRTKGKVK